MRSRSLRAMLWSALMMVMLFAAVASSVSDDDKKKIPNNDSTCDSPSPGGEEECENPAAGAAAAASTAESETFEPKFNAGGVRLVSKEELASKTGEDESEIWLSVLGEVYDVTGGRSYYGKGRSYGAFAGTDCSVCFMSGVFTAEEAEKSTDEVTTKLLPGLLDWRKFYATHDTYKFVGLLVDPRFYDDRGEPTQSMMELRNRAATIQVPKKKT